MSNTYLISTLSVSRWSARKFDRRATAELNSQKHASHDASRTNKQLVSKTSKLKYVRDCEVRLRAYHQSVTVAYDESVRRAVPNAFVLEMGERMQKLIDDFNAAADDYINNEYPRDRERAPRHLGDLYDPADFPQVWELRRKFAVHWSVEPSTDVVNGRAFGAFSEQLAQQLSAKLKAENDRRLERATNDLLTRAKESAERFEVLGKEKPRIFDSLVSQARDLADLLPALNIGGNTKVNAVAAELGRLAEFDADILRSSDSARAEILGRARALIGML